MTGFSEPYGEYVIAMCTQGIALATVANDAEWTVSQSCASPAFDTATLH